MTAEHFQAHPDEIRDLAGEFTSVVDELTAHIAGFVGDAIEIGEAFGLLGACTGVTSQYTEMVNNTSEGLNEIAQLLANSASGLQTSADNYTSVDTHTSSTMEV
ncbi:MULTISPECIES: type VII secretion target [unclassified Streptomyces]|uniref:WXG100 family type VII secretion target n=1 Tax=unclassified Streptomyces TaxID=2593676 RepID=UPI00344B7B08